MKRQFVDILGGLAAVSQTDRDAVRSSSTFSRRRRLRQHSISQDASSTCSSSPESKRPTDWHLFKAERSAVADTKTTMRRSCAAAVLACSAKPPSDSEKIVADYNNELQRRLRPTRRPTPSARRRFSANKENIADDEHCHSSKRPNSVSVCGPDVAYPRLFPDLNKVEEEGSSLVRTSSMVHEDLRCQATSTTMTLKDVSAISRTSDSEGGVLHRVRSTTSVSSLNGAFCSSSGDAEDEATAAAGAFCSTFSYPLHSTVIDSFFDVSALLPPRPLPSPSTAANNLVVDSLSPRQRWQLGGHDYGSSQYSRRRRSETESGKDSLHPRLFDNIDRPNLLPNDVPSSCQFADNDRRPLSTTVEQSSPSSATELDFARTNDSNCTARLRRQMGQTRLYTTNSSSSQRQSDFTCSRLNVDDDCSRSTLYECGCSAEQRFQRLPTADYDVLPTSKNFILSRSRRRCGEHFESQTCFTDTCRSWSSDRRRMTMHCPPATRTDALFTVDRPTDNALRHDRYQTIVDDQRQADCRQLRSLSHRRTADERPNRRQRVAPVPKDHVGGCPLCGCGRKSGGGDAAARRSSRTSKLTSSNCDGTAAERRRKRELLRKLRRFSDAFYRNTGELQLKTFGHL